MARICTIIDNEVLSMGEKLDKIMPIVNKYEQAMTPPDIEAGLYGVGDNRPKPSEDNERNKCDEEAKIILGITSLKID